jgi:antitoxin VapB
MRTAPAPVVDFKIPPKGNPENSLVPSQTKNELEHQNPETHRLAEELAKRTGESMTAAVTTAVRERLDRIRREQGASPAERLVEIGQDCAKRLKEPYRSADHDKLLYDDRGLPR